MPADKWKPRHLRTPLRPLRELELMGQQFQEDFVKPFVRSVWERMPVEERAWAPPVDVFERDDEFVVKAELPGMKLQDISVSVSDDVLTIKGDKKTEPDVKDENYYRNERTYGSFVRSIDLPEGVDSKRVEASYEDGVLEISIPKAAGAKPRQVNINVKKTGGS